MKIKKKNFFLGGGVRGGWVRGGGRVGGGSGVRVDVNEELKFLEKFTQKKFGGGGSVAEGVRLVRGQGGCERNVGGRG